jgi:hypothetical protein
MLNKKSILVSNRGIREGCVIDFILRTHVRTTASVPNVRMQWSGQKPFFYGRIKLTKERYAGF